MKHNHRLSLGQKRAKSGRAKTQTLGKMRTVRPANPVSASTTSEVSPGEVVETYEDSAKHAYRENKQRSLRQPRGAHESEKTDQIRPAKRQELLAASHGASLRR